MVGYCYLVVQVVRAAQADPVVWGIPDHLSFLLVPSYLVCLSPLGPKEPLCPLLPLCISSLSVLDESLSEELELEESNKLKEGSSGGGGSIGVHLDSSDCE